MITIKELQLDNDTALKLMNLIKKEEPEIWKVLQIEMKQALNIQSVSNCLHENEVMRQGDGSVYHQCLGCGELTD